MKEIKSKFIEKDPVFTFTTGVFRITSPIPDVEVYEQYHYLKSKNRIVYEKYETGILPKGVTMGTPNFRKFMLSPEKERMLKDASVIKVIFDCDKKKKRYGLTVVEFLDYKRVDLSSTSMRKTIEMLCSIDGPVDTGKLVREAGFKNAATFRASKRRLNAQIRKEFGTSKDFIDGEQGKGYRVSESFLVLRKS